MASPYGSIVDGASPILLGWLVLSWPAVDAAHEEEAAGDVRASRHCPAVPILPRRLTDELAEPRGERPEAGEPDEHADLRHRQVGRPQEILRPLDAPSREVAHRRLAVRLGEAAHEVVLRDVRRLGKRVE